MENAIIRFAKQVNSPTASKISKEKYLFICEQLGQEPDENAMPLEMEDFPPIVSLGIAIFNQLRDTYIPTEMPIYRGKDLTSLPVLLDIFEVTSQVEKEFLLRIINILDAEAVIAANKRRASNKPKVPTVKPGASSRV